MNPSDSSLQPNLDDFFALCSPSELTVFNVLAEYAHTLGYRPKKDKSQSLAFTFRHPKVKQTIMRFTSNREKVLLKLKFYAAPNYSTFFQETIRQTIEEYDYRYTGCYGCGNCDGSEGYTCRYPDGREFYRCGKELIEFFNPANLPLTETLELFRQQHVFSLELSKKSAGEKE